MTKKALKGARVDGDAPSEDPRTAAPDGNNGETPVNAWAEADRISDAIVDTINAELGRMRAADAFHPNQFLAGMLLGCMAFLRTAPERQPDSFRVMVAAIRACLTDLVEHYEPEGAPEGPQTPREPPPVALPDAQPGGDKGKAL